MKENVTSKYCNNEEHHVHQLLNYLDSALEKLNNTHESNEYTAYIHGQVNGIVMALSMLYPGHENWGQKAVSKVKPVLKEYKSEDED
ncbi:MAG: hypothetical protein K9L17_04715 [Clostridiales bacterium]|nr:hypothetical protein [Clostridiales bacterium]MCF8021977.1 hypothetical protein [Clostridiales bacterium]